MAYKGVNKDIEGLLHNKPFRIPNYGIFPEKNSIDFLKLCIDVLQISNKLLIVVGSDGLESGIGVRLAEWQGKTGYFTGFQFIFKSGDLSVALLNQINLLLFDCAPDGMRWNVPF